MVWLRQDDGVDEAPELMALARTQREADTILGIHTALQLYCAKHLTDGFLPELKVRRHLRGRLLDKFTAAGILHTAADTCECLDGRSWPCGMAYAVHHYLKSNPTREEYDLARAKAAELKDRELHVLVRQRDGDRCRYCNIATKAADRRSPAGMVLDHVDPAFANGAANLVVACKSCNSRKNNRTPEAAGMTLLPPPGELDPSWSAPAAQSSAAADEADVVAAPDDPAADQAPTSWPINASTNWSTNRSTTDATTPVWGRDGTGRVNVGDAGPNGHRDLVGPALPRLSSVHPDPYRRNAITGPDPANHAGLPSGEARGPPTNDHPSR